MPRITTGFIARLPCARSGQLTPHHVTPDGEARCTDCGAVLAKREG